jgi:hypothetical protein
VQDFRFMSGEMSAVGARPGQFFPTGAQANGYEEVLTAYRGESPRARPQRVNCRTRKGQMYVDEKEGALFDTDCGGSGDEFLP